MRRASLHPPLKNPGYGPGTIYVRTLKEYCTRLHYFSLIILTIFLGSPLSNQTYFNLFYFRLFIYIYALILIFHE